MAGTFNQLERNFVATAKDAARKILEQLSDQVTGNDIMYELYMKQKVEILGHDN